MSDWISVDELLPLRPDQSVIYESVNCIVTDGAMVGFCDFGRGCCGGESAPWACWSSYGDIRAGLITHWQPLPEPPK